MENDKIVDQEKTTALVEVEKVQLLYNKVTEEEKNIIEYIGLIPGDDLLEDIESMIERYRIINNDLSRTIKKWEEIRKSLQKNSNIEFKEIHDNYFKKA